jgi:hypothetical protein
MVLPSAGMAAAKREKTASVDTKAVGVRADFILFIRILLSFPYNSNLDS